ncbi:hypothetical protein BDV29DRAFT_172094 [Aspergillus leporis]|jgi:hypothetical protein|uniref:Uncharacterized protein n=1 Tax=Aspergillus leporis TaxID=41062 RepID=A0A5N5X7V5_9EURO|nr:hypothetical protein BDV29DRAFT_172094 [Aspergillus leporis]
MMSIVEQGVDNIIGSRFLRSLSLFFPLVYLTVLSLSLSLSVKLGGSVGTRNLTDIPRATNDPHHANYET